MSHPQAAIEDFCDTGSGTTPSRDKVDVFYGGGVPWVKSGELKDNVIFQTSETVTEAALKGTALKLAPAGAVLVAMYGATVGRVAQLGVPATTNQAVCHIVPDQRKADGRYIFHALRAKLPEFLNGRVGGAQPNISQQIIRRTKITLPPLDEQRRIAAILDAADSLRAKGRAALAKLDQLAQSIFIEMFGDPDTRKLTIGELLELGYLQLHKDGNHGSQYPRADEFGEVGIPFLSAQCIHESGAVLADRIQRLNFAKAERLKIGWIEAGDVLLAHNASVGKVALYEGLFAKALIGTSLTAFRPDNIHLTSAYLFSALRSPAFQLQLSKNMSQTTRNQVPITAQRLLYISVPPIEKQTRFSGVLAKYRNLRSSFEEAAHKIEHLFISLQSRAFKGAL